MHNIFRCKRSTDVLEKWKLCCDVKSSKSKDDQNKPTHQYSEIFETK